MIKETTTDRRVIKTKKAIKNAFAILVSEKDINDITIKEIAEVADINRNTFYQHYSGIYEIIEEIENELIQNIVYILDSFDLSNDTYEIYPIFKKMTVIINSDYDLYSNILFSNMNHNFVEKAVKMIYIKIEDALAKQFPIRPDKLSIMLTYALSGTMAVYKEWINSNRPESIEQIAKITSELFSSNIKSMIDTNIR